MQRVVTLLCTFLMSSTVTLAGDNKVSDANTVDRDTDSKFITDVFSHHWGYRQKIDLGGTWQIRLDPNEIGKEKGWQQGKDEFKDVIKIPGAPQAQGIGKTDNFRQKNFFWNEAFWCRRNFAMPEIAKGKRVWLRTGGILPAAEIFINGQYIGFTKSSRTQQRIDVTDFVKSGQDNLIAIKVCKLPRVRLDGMYEWMELSIMWMGIYRPISLEITDKISVMDAYLRPQLDSKSVNVEMKLSAPATEKLTVKMLVKDGEKKIGSAQADIPAGQKSLNAKVILDKFTTWAPEHPKLYIMDISITKSGSAEIDKVGIKFGMREIVTKGERFYLNGKPIYLRCFGDLSLFPDTLCPPVDLDWYRPRLKTAKGYGFNSVKGCVETMTEDFIEAADEVGIMVIHEIPSGVSDLRANRNVIDKTFRDYYSKELEGQVIMTRNHPSIIAYSMSSEIDFGSQTQESFDFFSKRLTGEAKQLAPNVLVIDCTGYVNTLETAKGTRNTDFYASLHPKGIKVVMDETEMETDHKRPMILHEYNWWSSYPDPLNRKKYEKSQIKPFWLDTLEKTAWKNGQGELLSLYRKNSLWLQELCQKDGLEYARRNKTVQGFIFFLLIDYYRYNEGILDDFWNPKTPTAQAEFLRSNGDTVILLAKDGDRCLNMGRQQIPLIISNYAEEKYPNSILKWKITGGPASLQGSLNIPELAYGELTQAGAAEFDLPQSNKAYKIDLEVNLSNGDKVINTNIWSFWAFPEVRPELQNVMSEQSAGKTIGKGVFLRLNLAKTAPIPADTNLVIANNVDEALVKYVESGGKCLLFSREIPIENTICYSGTTTFYTLFRTVPWNGGDSGNSCTVIGLHPAMHDFPHEGRCDLQFLAMIEGVLPMHFEPLRKYGVTPVIRVADHFLSNRNNAYMLEFKVGKGKVLTTTLGVLENTKRDLSKAGWVSVKPVIGANENKEAKYLLQCLVDYAQGQYFEPTTEIPADEFKKWFKAWKGSGNILSNGGFESGDMKEAADNAKDEPGTWHNRSTTVCGDDTWAVTSEKVHSGKFSLKHGPIGWYDPNGTCTGVPAKDMGSSHAMIINDAMPYADVHSDITFRGWINVEDLEKDVEYEVWVFNAATGNPSNKAKFKGGEAGWKSFEVNIGKLSVHDGRSTLQIILSSANGNGQFGKPTAGAVYFDDFELIYSHGKPN